jgi:hypothetical protein
MNIKKQLQKILMYVQHLENDNVFLDNKVAEYETQPPYQNYVNLFAENKRLSEENARLRDALRWNPVSELPPVDERFTDRKVSVFVLIKTWGTMIRLGYYDFEEECWKYARGETIVLTEMLRWLSIPADKDGDE